MFKPKLPETRTTLHLITRTMTSKNPDVLFKKFNNSGIITLNRPEDLNCLTTSMISKILPKLKEWESTTSLIITKGLKGNIFCAGGDVKLCIDKENAPSFFWHLYNLIYLISRYSIPYISLNDGYTMGGGLGISMPGKYRIATERTVMAMPENKIGICPAVGATYFLPRLNYKIGYYIGMTGEKLKGCDTVKAGLATNFVPSARLQELESALSICTNEESIAAVLKKFCEHSDQFSLTPYIKDIEYCFSAPTMDGIMKRLENTNNEWSVKTLKLLHEVCPGSLKTTLRAFQAGAGMTLKECLFMEYRIIEHAAENTDFREGVRALVLDKDNNPKWNPESLAEVTDSYVQRHFQKLSPDKELYFSY